MRAHRAEYDPTRPPGHKWLVWDPENDFADDSPKRTEVGKGDLYAEALADFLEQVNEG